MAKVIFTNEQAFKALQLLIKYFKRKPDYANKSAGYRSFKWDWAATKEISGAIKILQKAKLPEGWRVRSTDKQRPDMREPIKVSSFSITAPLDFVEWKKKIKKAEVASLQDVQLYMETAIKRKLGRKIYAGKEADSAILYIKRILHGQLPIYKKIAKRTIVSWVVARRDVQNILTKVSNKSIDYELVNGNKLCISVSPDYKVEPEDMDYNSLKKQMKDLAVKSADVREYIKMAKALSELD